MSPAPEAMRDGMPDTWHPVQGGSCTLASAASTGHSAAFRAGSDLAAARKEHEQASLALAAAERSLFDIAAQLGAAERQRAARQAEYDAAQTSGIHVARRGALRRNVVDTMARQAGLRSSHAAAVLTAQRSRRAVEASQSRLQRAEALSAEAAAVCKAAALAGLGAMIK